MRLSTLSLASATERVASKCVASLLIVSFSLTPLSAFGEEFSEDAGATPTSDVPIAPNDAPQDSPTAAPIEQGNEDGGTPPVEDEASSEPAIGESSSPEEGLAEESAASDTDADEKPEVDDEVIDDPQMSLLLGSTQAGDRVRYAEPPQARVDNVSGALTQEVPIDLPPGRNGLQPSLSLTYNSQRYEDSEVGFGWSISIPYIERHNRAGVDTLYSDNYFSSSIYGELASTSGGVYRPRVDNGDFVEFRLNNNKWVAYDKQGVQYKYGFASSTQLYSTATTSNTGKWMLEEVRDTNGNYIKYTYAKSDNQIYPATIVYTG